MCECKDVFPSKRHFICELSTLDGLHGSVHVFMTVIQNIRCAIFCIMEKLRKETHMAQEQEKSCIQHPLTCNESVTYEK